MMIYILNLIIHKNNKKYVLTGILYLLFFLFFSRIISGCLPFEDQNQLAEENPGLTVHFLDVGNADSAFIVSGGETMLIDAGERGDSAFIINFIQNLGFHGINLLVGTHPHSDHIGGMADIVRSLEIGGILMPEAPHNTQTFEDTLDAIIEKDISVHSPEPGEVFSLGSARVTVLSPERIDENNLNNCSIVLKITLGDVSVIFTGDAEQEAEADILSSALDIRGDILKLGHHGSSTSSSEDFLSAVNPSVAIISVGAGNQYGHPGGEVLERLESVEAVVYRTDIHGTITLTTDGASFEITTEKGSLTAAGAPPSEAEPHGTETDNALEAPVYPESPEEPYIGNRNSKVFHIPGCSSLPNEENRVPFNNRKEAENNGFRPCGRCLG